MDNNNFGQAPPVQQPQDDNGILDANDLDVNIANDPVISPAFSDSFQPSESMQSVQKMVVSLPSEASDTDLIEKEWINVLQNIVKHTSEDPYTQQAEISKVKADYMKKRYNKDIKQSG